MQERGGACPATARVRGYRAGSVPWRGRPAAARAIAAAPRPALAAGSENPYSSPAERRGRAPQMYHTKLVQLFEEGAENPDSEAHAQLVDLLALKVRRARARPLAGRVRVGTHRMSQAAR